jgi:hypothetical protein
MTLDNIRKRTPTLSDIFAVFYVCVFLFHIWSIPVFLYEVPGMILYMNLWELIQVMAYNQAFILLECIFLTLALVLFCFFLPERLFRAQFVKQAVFVILLIAIGSVLFDQTEPFVIRIHPAWVERVGGWQLPSPGVKNLITSDTFLFQVILFALLTTWLSLLVLSPIIVKKFRRLEKQILALANRVSVLCWMFIIFDTFGFVIVLANNLT